ncbi:MAG: hypothetical protein M3Q23_17200 [Actinomycetota bacterium]|nr:hypothetical protein [Actinomycetota bacterium]
MSAEVPLDEAEFGRWRVNATARSPGPAQHYGEADSTQAFQDAAAILRWVDGQWEGLRGA